MKISVKKEELKRVLEGLGRVAAFGSTIGIGILVDRAVRHIAPKKTGIFVKIAIGLACITIGRFAEEPSIKVWADIYAEVMKLVDEFSKTGLIEWEDDVVVVEEESGT